MSSHIELEGMEQIQRKIMELGRKGQTIENKALKAGAEIVRQKISEEAPRSNKPRQPAKGTQSWRTGKHAADNISASNVKKVDGMKVVEVGVSKADNDNYFYLKFHEFGTVKMSPNPFMERSMKLSSNQARVIIRTELKKGLGL